MAINIKFDLTGNPEPPTIILAKRNGNRLGQLEVEPESIELNDKFNDASEFSFTLYKYIDNKITNLWNEVVDFKLVYCKEWDMWFEITVELDEETETVKTVMCTQLGQAELSQIMIYDMHINEEGDINWNTDNKEYKSTILYNPDDTSTSLLHRLLKDKAPHYSIRKVDSTIANIQRTFSFDGTSIYDACMEIAEEIGCLFVFHSDSDEDGNIQRSFSVYDLQQNCMNADCNHRGEFIDKCPECGGTNIKYGYGIDTTIFVTADELAASGIQLTTDTDSVKNCFKLEAGDDTMTATVINCNPNGTPYIWYFSDAVKADMTKELVDRIESYDVYYKHYYDAHEFTTVCSDSECTVEGTLDTTEYNKLIEKYMPLYNIKSSTCLACGYKGDFETSCSECGSTSIYAKNKLKTVSTIKGYPSLMNVYYDAIDLRLFLESSLMPSVDIGLDKTTAEEQAGFLTSDSLSPVGVADLKITSATTADNAILSMAKLLVRSTYKIDVVDDSSELSDYSEDEDVRTWKGKFVITNYSDETDTYTTDVIPVTINGDAETFIQQKIDKALNKENTDDYSISGLFEKDVVVTVVNGENVFSGDFYDELKNYALNPLSNFETACQACIDILTEQDAANPDINKDLYDKLYTPYYNKLLAIQAEMLIRENEVNFIKGVYDSEGKLKTEGFQAKIEKLKTEVKNALDFESYLGKDLWFEFCTYRREDKYENSNYISDGLSNAEMFKKASEFIKVAENEIYKSAELQHSISTSLKNLLAIEKFKPLVEHFSVGNWIRIRIDDQIYKLRLLEYGISFGGFDEISVEFSDVIKIKNGITDMQSVLSQASSMATSYSSVQKQASQGEESKGTIDQWISNGLNSAQVRIQSNDTEDVVLDKNGLLCRSYNDITDAYDPEQFRLTHNMMAYTSDNWKTVSAALGKHDYKYFNDNKELVDGTGYGLSAEFVTAGYVTGSQIIGGDIFSDNYSNTEGTGSYLNLRDGTFSFGGGALRFENGKLLLSSPDIPTTETITEINEEYLKTTSVYAENLQINSAHIKGKLIIGQLPDTVAETEDIPTKVSQLNNDSGYQTATGVTTIVNGVVTTDYVNALGIKAGSVDAENISGTTISGKTLSGMSGEIGGWTINTYNLYSTDGTNTVSLNSDDGSVRLSNADGNVIHQGWVSTYGSSTGSSTLDITAAGINLNFVDETQAINFNDSSSNTILSLTESGISDKNQLDRFYFTAAGRTDIVAKTDLYLKCDGVQSDDVGRSLVFRYCDNAATTGSTIKEPFFMPCKTGVTNLGGISYRWKDIYSANAVNVSSDRNLKKDIQFLDEKYIQLFDLLEPVSFKFVDGTSGRTHIGFIAQDVEDAMEQVGLTSLDFAGFCKNTIINENGGQVDIYSLRYGEFTALNTAKIKQLEQQVIKLRNEIKELKS